MSKRRKITMTETEFLALASAVAAYEGLLMEDDLVSGHEAEYRAKLRSMRRVLRKWHEAGR